MIMCATRLPLVLVAMVMSLVTVSGTGDGTIIINSLGRTFTLGMLYDRRSDRILPGKTLWKPETLAKGTHRSDFRSSKYEVEMRDSVQDKLNFMKVDAGLKASFMGGLVSVEGSAGYLSDSRATSNIARVVVKYHAETYFHQLTMAHLALSNIEYPAVLDDKEATHVVVGIDYGAEAYFIFEKEFQDSSNIEEIYGSLKIVVNKIPTISIEGHGSLELNSELRSKVSDLKVKFHGDFILDTNPTTFEQAVEIYQNLPNLMKGENAQSVPMRVHLCPLKKIDETKLFSIVRDISESLISELVKVMQDFEDCTEAAQELRQSVAASHFLVYRQRIDRFLNVLNQYKLRFQSTISPLLVEIRGRGKEESELAEVLVQHAASPFNRVQLDRWLREQRAESQILRAFVSLLDQKVTFSKTWGEYKSHTLTNHELVSLKIDFPDFQDVFLDNTDMFLRRNISSSNPVIQRKWYEENSVLHHVVANIEQLLQFREANLNSTVMFTYVVSTPEMRTLLVPQAHIRVNYYQGGRKHAENLTPPSHPHGLRQSAHLNSVNLTWNPPSHGSDFIDHYSVVVTEKGHRIGQTPVKHVFQTQSNETSFLIASPDSSVPYDVHVFGVCRVGRTASSEVLHHNGVEVRLVGGAEICSPRRAHSGRIEVLHNHIWGTICGPWGDKESAVACRMIGFASGVVSYVSNTSGSGQIWMSGVRCSGSESNLDECEFHWAVEGECNHTMDVVVECYGGELTGDASTPEQCSINELQSQLALSRSNLNLATTNLNMAREELNRERVARERNITSLDQRFSSLSNTTDRLSRSFQKSFSVAFHATANYFLWRTILSGGNVIFEGVRLNIGNGYNPSTGVFTVPSGGAGLYYFFVQLTGSPGEFSYFLLKRNSQLLLCTIYLNDDNGSCAATVQVNSGDHVSVVRDGATDNTPLFGFLNNNGFTGFLLKPDA